LGKEVQFKDLGLLIIDEEQKFGVNAKDKLKTLRVNVDTLTLTATPIPRTLQFSLLGARDLSVIRTPPGNRYPILTELKGFNEEFIRDTIQLELERGGQVFFLHNRIQNLPEMAGVLQRLVPDARIRYAHGQMDGKALEEIMLEFIRGDFDVLVSTSIIENGLDVPNANTILIHEAQNYGLSDLHQMRGRVGRGNRKAFCYLITPPFHALAAESKRRLQALIEFSDLGSGFHIAMKDLDIRGAGDLLGADQSGFVNEMGYETYQRVLAEAIQELKEEAFAEEFKEEMNSQEHRWAVDCQIDTDLPLLLPETYVDSMAERLALYKELDSLQQDHEIPAFESRLRDRFGPLPGPATDLLLALKLRLKAQNLGIERISLKQGHLQAGFPGQERAAYYSSGLFSKILAKIGNRRDVEMRQQKTRLVLHFNGVKTMTDALGVVEGLMA
jgi:transcription-repair coupling factor (superfamily II helicase)